MALDITLQEKNASVVITRSMMLSTFPLGSYLQASANGSDFVDIKDGSLFIFKRVPYGSFKDSSGAAFGASQAATVTALNVLLDKRLLDDFIVKDDTSALSGTTKFRHKADSGGADRDVGGSLELGLHSASIGLYGSYFEITETDLSNTTGKTAAYGRLKGYLESLNTPVNWLDVAMGSVYGQAVGDFNFATLDISGVVTFSGSTSGIDYGDLDNTPAAYAISSDLLDEDNMATNSATKVASQQSIKAYVDGKTHLELGTSSSTALAGDTTTISGGQASAITANTAKVTFPGLGTTSSTALAGDTALLALGTSSSTALAGDTSIPSGNAIIDWTASGAGTIHTDNYIENVVQTTITGNAGTATALATARAINGVDFDGTGAITVTAAGSTLSDTVTVAKGGTGATTLTNNAVLIGNATSAVESSAYVTHGQGYLTFGGASSSTSGAIRFKEAADNGTATLIIATPADYSNDDYVLTLPLNTGTVALTSDITGGGIGTSDQTLDANRTIDTNGYNLDVELDASGTPDTFKIHDGTNDLFEVNTTTSGVIFSVNDTSGVSKLSVNASSGVTIDKLKTIVFEKTADTDYSYQGDIVKFGTGSTQAGKLCYYKSDGTWAATDADAVATSGGVLLGIALGTDPDVDGVLIRGMFTLDHDPGTIADELYVSTTLGSITGTAPSATGDIVRVIGYCLDSANGQIWFNPSNDFIVLA
jgi:hypothetical protein